MRHVLGEPILVAATIKCTGDYAEMLITQTHDGEVAAEAATLCEEGGVNRTTNRYVNVVHAHVLQERNNTRAGEIKFVECGEIYHSNRLAHLQVLCVGDWRPPAAVPFALARCALVFELVNKFGVRSEPLWSFPTARIEECCTSCFLARVEGATAHVSLCSPLLARVHDAVGLVEVLVATGVNVVFGFLVRVKAADIRRVWVAQVWVAVSHPFGNQLRDAGAFLDPDCSSRPQVANLDGFTKHWHRVWCE